MLNIYTHKNPFGVAFYAASQWMENKKGISLFLIAYAFAYKHRVRSHGFTRSIHKVHGHLCVNMQHRFIFAREIYRIIDLGGEERDK